MKVNLKTKEKNQKPSKRFGNSTANLSVKTNWQQNQKKKQAQI